MSFELMNHKLTKREQDNLSYVSINMRQVSESFKKIFIVTSLYLGTVICTLSYFYIISKLSLMSLSLLLTLNFCFTLGILYMLINSKLIDYTLSRIVTRF